MSDPEPPTLTLLWCPACGRTDNFGRSVLTEKHYRGDAGHAEVCPGQPVRVQYEPVRQGALREDRPPTTEDECGYFDRPPPIPGVGRVARPPRIESVDGVGVEFLLWVRETLLALEGRIAELERGQT